MKIKLNPKLKNGQINVLTNKDQFTIGDLKKILDSLDEKAEVKFGWYVEGSQPVFCQNANFIFRLKPTEKSNLDTNQYVLEIITDVM
jgi:hypothetical protein